MKSITDVPADDKQAGLNYWMDCVMREWVRASRDFAPEPIHDLRVTLRRCRAIADGFGVLDPHPAWKQMRREGKKLFKQLGALRDTQVMMDWVRRMAPKTNESFILMNRHLSERETKSKRNAEKALKNFKIKKWASWNRFLSQRTKHIPPEHPVFRHVALERWAEMRALHRQALRNRSHAGYHRLRIGLKKFRYTVENFLPSQYVLWGADLKRLQDLLGEMHDLQVLWQTALSIGALTGEENRMEWRQKIAQESRQRLDEYRDKMLGKTSLALVWRSGLPDKTEIGTASLDRLQAWASFRDPDFDVSKLTAKLALQIYDGLESFGLAPASALPDARRLLEAAAFLHNIGLSKTRKKYNITSYRMICKLDAPMGLSKDTLRHIALIARFHRGPIPRSEQKAFTGIPEEQKNALILLCGILRLANAFNSLRKKRIQSLELRKLNGFLHINAPGYSKMDASAEKLAAARHLLEMACGLPILIE